MTVLLANGPDSFVWWEWVGDHRGEIWTRTVEHLQLTAIAITVGFAISSVLAWISVRRRWLYGPITVVGSVLYTIPSLALFGLLLPFTHLGLLTAEIALVSYTILILVRNIVAGIDAVPAATRDAAVGMGYTPARLLLRVELPLALPTIVAGIRIATVTTIGLVTLTVYVGNGGYGAFIEDGISRSFSTPIVVGATLSIALAIVADAALYACQRLLTPWTRATGRRATRRREGI